MTLAQRHPRLRRRRAVSVLVGVVAAVALFAVITVVGGLFGLGWLGQSEVIDRGTVVGVLRKESTLTAASRDYRTRVEFSEDEVGDWAPSWLFGRRFLVDVDGTVPAEFDLSAVGDDSITVTGDDVEVRLPSPTIGAPTIEDITVVADDRGFVNRINDFLSRDPEQPDEIVSTAQEQLRDTAADDYELRRLAENSARDTIMDLLEPVVTGEITVRFESDDKSA